MPKPLYSARTETLELDGEYWPVMIRSVTRRRENGSLGMSMGGPVAYCDTKEQADKLAEILNAALPPNPEEPE